MSEPAIECRPLMNQVSLFEPVLSPILRDRRLVIILLVAAIAQLSLVSFQLPGWPCPFFHVLGIPCPGCGLTRATLLLFRGDWKQSIAFHAFAPVFMMVLITTSASAVMPRKIRDRLIPIIEIMERRFGLSSFLLLALILYWLARLLILQSAFVRLIQG
jgi:hypothetical protein